MHGLDVHGLPMRVARPWGGSQGKTCPSRLAFRVIRGHSAQGLHFYRPRSNLESSGID